MLNCFEIKLYISFYNLLGSINVYSLIINILIIIYFICFTDRFHFSLYGDFFAFINIDLLKIFEAFFMLNTFLSLQKINLLNLAKILHCLDKIWFSFFFNLMAFGLQSYVLLLLMNNHLF